MSTQAPPSAENLSPLDAVHCHARTDIGQKREENQDSFGAIETDEYKFYFVCDGMGGVKGGAVASQLAVATIEQSLNSQPGEMTVDAIRAAIADANIAIFDRGSADEQLTGMGTTLVGIAFVDQRMLITSVGDSRAYRIRDGEILQLTEDHTLVMELLRSGSITEEQAVNHPVSHMLTRSLGPTPDITIDCWESEDAPRPGDRYLLCSDGLYNMLGLEELGEVILSLPPEEAVEELVSLANLRGGHDNITVMLVSIGDEYPAELTSSYASSNVEQHQEPALGEELRVELESDSGDKSAPRGASMKGGGPLDPQSTSASEKISLSANSAESPTGAAAVSQRQAKSVSSPAQVVGEGFVMKPAAAESDSAPSEVSGARPATLDPSPVLDDSAKRSSRAVQGGNPVGQEGGKRSATTRGKSPVGATSQHASASSVEPQVASVTAGIAPQSAVREIRNEKALSFGNRQIQLLLALVVGVTGAYYLGHFHGSDADAISMSSLSESSIPELGGADRRLGDTALGGSALERIRRDVGLTDQAVSQDVPRRNEGAQSAGEQSVNALYPDQVAPNATERSLGDTNSVADQEAVDIAVADPSVRTSDKNADGSDAGLVVGPVVDTHAEDRRSQLDKLVQNLEQRLAAFREPLTGRAGELLRVASADIERISKELEVTRSQIDAATRGLTIWLGRKKRLQTSDPINLASEVAVSSETVREKQNQFNEATWAFLKQSEVLRFNPNDKTLEREVADLARQRLASMRALIESVRQAIEAELRKSEKSIESLTLTRVDLESQLEDARRDVEYVKALASSDSRVRDAKKLELQRLLDVARAELEELSRVGAATGGIR